MNITNLTPIIIACIEKYLEKGLTDKEEIFYKVCDELGVPRPTVRRVARDMRTEMLRKIKILQSEIPLPSDPTESKWRFVKTVEVSMKINQSTVIPVTLNGFGEDRKLNCQNCEKPIRDHDAERAHECLELTSLEIITQNQTQIIEEPKEVTVPALWVINANVVEVSINANIPTALFLLI